MTVEQATLISSYLFLWNIVIQITLGFFLGYKLGAYE